jgi:hypothetical protein
LEQTCLVEQAAIPLGGHGFYQGLFTHNQFFPIIMGIHSPGRKKAKRGKKKHGMMWHACMAV